MPERQYLTLSKRIIDRLTVDNKDAVFLGPGHARIRRPVLPFRGQGLRGADPGHLPLHRLTKITS